MHDSFIFTPSNPPGTCKVGPLQYLPVAIHNHKGRVAAEDCYIANVFKAVDCVDRSQSELTESALKPGQLSILKRLQLDRERIPPDARLFRLKDMPALLIVRGDLRARLEEAGIAPQLAGAGNGPHQRPLPLEGGAGNGHGPGGAGRLAHVGEGQADAAGVLTAC